MLIRGAEICGRRRDVRIDGGVVREVDTSLSLREGELQFDADGGALLPGLHDHHLHLFAWAAAERSARCGPPHVRDVRQLHAALETAIPNAGWLRGVGYHESVAGSLDRWQLDAFALAHPMRVQHRSGKLWVIDSRGVAALGLDAGSDAPGVERGADGRATGRLYDLDMWLRERLPPRERPSLAAVGAHLADWGVCGVSDATPGNTAEELSAFAAAVASGDIPQRLAVLGSEALPEPSGTDRITRGPIKMVLDETRLPGFDELTERISDAHSAARPVAIHCVTRVELVLAVAALRAAGGVAGDRIEHAAVAPDDLLPQLAELPLTVVTQPNFVAERGDAYLADVELRDQPWLYRCRGFLDAGIPVAGSTDAPFGDPDPWRAMRAAVERLTDAGETLGADEALTPEQALALFTAPLATPGGAARRIAPGLPADLCLLRDPWDAARQELRADRVRATWCAGEQVAGE